MNRKLENFFLLNARYHYELRKVLAEDFKSLNGELPIKGGWGYNIDDAIIIDKNDEVVDKESLFDGVGIEYIIVEKRLYEELIIFRSNEDKFCDISWKLLKQSILTHDGKNYDHLIFEGTCFADEDFNTLKNELIENKNKAGFNMNEHLEKREMLQYHFKTEYYFDITSFYA